MIRVPFIDLSRQYRSLHEEIERAIARTLAGGWYILGDEVRAFEREFAAYCGARHAIGVGSGTEALHLALLACGIQPGDAVATVPNIAAPTACAILSAAARPVFIDIDPATYTLDPTRLRTFLKAQRAPLRIKAVLPVHLYGLPADMNGLLEVAREFGLKVIEDAAQAHGAVHDGRHVGALGDAGCFSFYPTKNLGAYGDAGMVVCDDDRTAEQVRMLRNYGEEEKYRNKIPGFNSRLDELQAAVLRVKLKHLDNWVAARRHYAQLYAELLAHTALALPVEPFSRRHAYHLYVVRSRERNRLRQYLEGEGIATSIHYPTPLHLQEAFRNLGYGPGDLPDSERACHEVLSLPLFPELTTEEVHFVGEQVSCFR